MHRILTTKIAFGTVLVIAIMTGEGVSGAHAADVCEALWRARNAIFANNGYCFTSAEALAVFGKGCFATYGKLSPAEDADVQRIKDIETNQSCPAVPAGVSRAAAAPVQDGGRVLPKYVVQLALSRAAANKLSASGETIRVSASYYGNSASAAQAGDDGQIGLANETVDLPAGTMAVNLGGISIAERDIRKTAEGKPMLLINVYTSRKVFENNLLDCGIYQGDAATAGQVEITCKLIGE